MFNFEKLEVWQKAIDFADAVYRITKSFPSDERFGLTNQMRRASVSISSNLADGSSRSSNIDYARFVEIATGSAFEVVSQCFIAQRQALITDADFAFLYEEAATISRMSSGLRTYLLTPPSH